MQCNGFKVRFGVLDRHWGRPLVIYTTICIYIVIGGQYLKRIYDATTHLP